MRRLTPELLLRAYCQGLFPMARSRRGPIEWYRADPRAVFDPHRVHLSRRLLRTVRQGVYDVRINADFAGVIAACAGRADTWISPEIERVYGDLHALGFAHSVEAYRGGVLVGGLYGVAIGGAFMGESMFSETRCAGPTCRFPGCERPERVPRGASLHRATDASKVCFAHLVARLCERGYVILDSQSMTEHLASLGAFYVTAAQYEAILARALRLDCRFT
jgi:leucyl/phenylalanyl-tRNA---protein transferase